MSTFPLDHRTALLTGGSAKLWPAVLKKGSTSSAVTSATAHGFLPQYSGNLQMSLSPGKVLAAEASDTDHGGARLSPGPDKKRENLPPRGVSTLEDQFRNLSVEAANLHAASSFQI